jgi:hypothetical protein
MQQAAVWLAVAGFCVPQVAFAAAPENQTPMICDLMLHQGGTMVGQVVDSQGAALAKVPVALRGVAGELASSQTNAKGYFAFSGMKGGVYEVATPAGSGVYRVWSPGGAPPAAQPGALIVAGSETLRGQCCDPCSPCGGVLGFFGKHPLLTATLIAAAIAIPIAVTADDGPKDPGTPN